jgi:ABC-type transporter Mla MlaB component
VSWIEKFDFVAGRAKPPRGHAAPSAGHAMSFGDLGLHTVALSGPATLYELVEIRESLLAAMAEGKDLRIDLETTGPWDLSGLQLLISATASGRRAGQAVRLVNVPRGCVEIAERSGLAAWLSGVSDSFM